MPSSGDGPCSPNEREQDAMERTSNDPIDIQPEKAYSLTARKFPVAVSNQRTTYPYSQVGDASLTKVHAILKNWQGQQQLGLHELTLH